MTVQPLVRSKRTTLLSRLRFPSIFALQKGRLVAGMERHDEQPCQKQPSTNVATRRRGKMTSGWPGRPESYPSLHPLTPERTNRDRSFHSVDFAPRERLEAMTRERVALSNLSTVTDPFARPQDCIARPAGAIGPALETRRSSNSKGEGISPVRESDLRPPGSFLTSASLSS
jgi:hypothetical protein